MDHPRVEITDLESQLGTRYTAEMLDKLHQMYPGVTFVWLMGADNLKQFHRWQNWQGILASTPIGVIARPGQRVAARMSVAASIFERARVPARASQTLGRIGTPAWCFVNVPMNDASSTEIRNAGDWDRD
jgi:nicotinate-nucleotide adenylyltransferase